VALLPGTRFGSYEIVSPLGAGGMGEVYRARDTKLNREVAIKVLAGSVAGDPDRLARFAREAQLLATLNHPNIAGIYGLVDDGPVTALALELVEGPTLADRLAQGRLPMDEALAIARQIASALEAAHDAGIVHRDLKPANVKVRPDGAVKVLDFGLAKALSSTSASRTSINQAESPTMLAAGTDAGMILGTAAYMAPEQARGRPVDKRADIWAFGVVLWEMLTGRMLFQGETVSDTLAAVLTKTPDFAALPAATPPSVRRAVERCLQRDPARRLRDAGDVRLDLDAADASADVGTGPKPRPRHVWIGWAAAGALGLTLAGVLVWPRPAPRSGRGRPLQFTVQLSPDRPLATRLGSNILIAPDGQSLVYAAGAASNDTVRQLLVNRVDGSSSTVIPGVPNAFAPFVSPDGQWIGFFASDSLQKVGLRGGAGISLARGGIDSRGGTWGADGTIVYSPTFASGLWRVPASGGAAAQLTHLDDSLDERSHRWPSFLPSGREVLFMTQRVGEDYDDADIEVVSLAEGRRKVLVRGGAYPRYAPGGWLLFVRAHTLYAVAFDAERLEVDGQPPRPVAEGVLASTGDQESGDGSAEYDVSASGTLVYRATTGGQAVEGTEFVWLDTRGAVTPAFKEAFRAVSLEISPDGRTVAIDGRSETGLGIWLRDLERGSVTPLNSSRGGESQSTWSPDGRWLAFGARAADKTRSIILRAMTGSDPERTLQQASGPTSWSADGKTLYADVRGDGTSLDIHSIDLSGGSGSRPVVRSSEVDAGARLSPDGRWLLYYSLQNGTQHVYVQPAGADRPRWQVSTDRGNQARWSRDGRRIYYVRVAPPNVPGTVVPEAGRILAVDVREVDGGLQFGPPQTIYEGSSLSSSPERPIYDVHPDGRLLLIRRASPAAPNDTSHVVVALDWAASLGQVVPR
jgi:Tol biopolymer transport system component